MKFAQVGYGSDGRGGLLKGGYTYIVNDNVKTGEKLNVLVSHANTKQIFATTGKVLTNRELQNIGLNTKGLSRTPQNGNIAVDGNGYIKVDSDGNLMINRGGQYETYTNSNMAISNTDLGVRKRMGGTSEEYTLEARRNLMSTYNTEQQNKGLAQPDFSQGPRTQEALSYQTNKEKEDEIIRSTKI